jgi:hypothetical protein
MGTGVRRGRGKRCKGRRNGAVVRRGKGRRKGAGVGGGVMQGYWEKEERMNGHWS